MRKFNLSLDDMSPHPHAGLNFESIDWCNKLIIKYPEIKIDLFVPAAYARLGQNPYYISQYQEWIKKVKDLPHNYNINLHGFHHRRTTTKYPISNNNEFEFLNKTETSKIILKIKNEFNKAGIMYNSVFRPPGWYISKDAVAFLTEQKFIIAGNSVYYNKYKGTIKNLKWVSVNWDLLSNPPNETVMVAYGHTSDWTNNYMNEERYNKICSVLEKEQFEYSFLKELGK
ncbi:MAG: DUF2334 domain-containing protein [Patescibacteria group bacterium]